MVQTHFVKSGKSWQCLAGFRMRRILSAELFMDLSSHGSSYSSSYLAGRCRDRWTDLAGTLSALPDPAEFHLILACNPAGNGDFPVFETGVLAVGRSNTKARAKKHCLDSLENLNKLFTAILDYAEFQLITVPGGLDGFVSHLDAKHLVEIKRRQELIHIGRGRMVSEPIRGFSSRTKTQNDKTGTSLHIPHLFPWVPNDDPWWRLVDVMAKESCPAALVVHARGWQTAPEECREDAHHHLSGVERAVDLLGNEGDEMHVLRLKAGTLREESLFRLSALEGPMIGARVFLASGSKASGALLSVVESSLDDPSVSHEQPGGLLLFRGGADIIKSNQKELLATLDSPTIDVLFSPREAPSVLRTPMPTESEYPGFPLNRARTAPILGHTGSDCPLGRNIHRGLSREVAMDTKARYRHCYIIGQTGTGKSTLMQHKILHDINAGRGVGVLDPHGTLIEDILLRFPRKRAKDLVIMDMTDVDNPVGFNPLFIQEGDPFAYRIRRDLLIDELYTHLDKVYDLAKTGGPIFETHFRAMLGLLLGLEQPEPPCIPNLMVFRMLYTSEELRRHLTGRIQGRDGMLEDFVQEAMAAGGDLKMNNIAPYITSKFSRFISDLNLRNITCQSRSLDLDKIVAEGKVLLVHLGKGRIGEQAAGLLASQLISRVQQAVMKRGREGQLTPYHLYADEFQMVASERFAELLAEGRKFGLSLTVAHQFASQIPPEVLRAVLGNVGTTVLFRVGAQDSEVFAPLFSPTFGKRDLVSLPNFRAYVRGVGALGEAPFNVDVAPPSEKIDEEYAQNLRDRVRRKYGRGREEVDLEIQETVKAFRALR